MITRDEVVQIVKENIVEILPDLSIDSIDIKESLKNIGANSIDRMDIVVSSMEALGIKIPMMEFSSVSNIEGLINLLYEKKVEQG